MRIWDVPPDILCRQHLLGEHRELHAVWAVLTEGKRGYARHPETRRWEGKLAALFTRHAALVREMECRGYQHRSPLDDELATGSAVQDVFLDPVARQVELLALKPCACVVPLDSGTAERDTHPIEPGVVGTDAGGEATRQ